MKKLADYREKIANCNKCGYCQAHCPSFRVTKNESMVARGRLELIKNVLDGRLELTETLINRMNQCVLCGNCTEFCTPAVDTADIIEAMRNEITAKKGLSKTAQMLRTNVTGVGNITGDSPENRLLWLNNISDKIQGMKINKPAEYAYLTGCVPALYPSSYSIAQSFVQILLGANVDFTVLADEEKCCGYPLLIGGLASDGVAVARENVARLRALGVKKLVFTCPSCYHVWKEYYPEILGEKTGFEIYHGLELMLSLVKSGKLKLKEYPQTVTYHDPCDLGRKSKIFDAPRELITLIPGITFKDMHLCREDSMCCGGGGNLEMNDAALSSKIAAERVAQAQETGASVILTACQQCKRTLQGGARASRARIKVVDLSELILSLIDSGEA